MDDQTLRRKLSQLRIPPPDSVATDRALETALQARALGRAAAEPAVRWSWQDWLWPSPLAWSAMAVLWIIIAARAITEPARDAAQEPFVQSTLNSTDPGAPVFARHDYTALLQEFHRGAPLR